MLLPVIFEIEMRVCSLRIDGASYSHRQMITKIWAAVASSFAQPSLVLRGARWNVLAACQGGGDLRLRVQSTLKGEDKTGTLIIGSVVLVLAFVNSDKEFMYGNMHFMSASYSTFQVSCI